MKRKIWQYVWVFCLLAAMLAGGSRKVSAATTPCGECPAGQVCVQMDPEVWVCEGEVLPPPPPPPPPGQVACGASDAPACGGYCDRGGCVSTEANPDCHCSGGAGQAPVCEGGTVLKCGSPKVYSNGSNIENCGQRGACWRDFFPSKFEFTGCENMEVKGSCQDNCGCCAADDPYTCSFTTGSNYTRINDCRSPKQCNDWDDKYVSHTEAPQTEANRCYCAEPEGEWRAWLCTGWVYKIKTTCKQRTLNCACTCTAVAPSTPTLVSPANGATLTGTTVNLYWNSVASWGKACSGANNTYRILTGTNGTNFSTYKTVSSATNTTGFTGTAGTTYYWKVRAHNGQLYTDSAARSFLICNTTSPTNLQNQSVTSSGATVKWTPGSNGTSQRFYLGTSQTKVNNNCSGAGAACAVADTSLTTTKSSYAVSGLQADTTYYYKIVTYINNSCSAFATGSVTTDDVAPPSPPPASAWWQTIDGSVHSAGDLVSAIPSTCIGSCRPNLLRQSISGASGLLSFNGAVGLGSGTISQDGTNWQAKTVFSGTQTGFNYFKRLLSDDPAGIGEWDGGRPAQNGVYLAEGDVTTVGDWTVGAGDILVLLAGGNVTIGGNINVDPGGFLAVIASGDIIVSASVTNIEGVFITDQFFRTGAGAGQLRAEGIFAAWDGVDFQRVLPDNSLTPAELFVYRPDLQLNAYRYLLWLNIAWREAAP